MKHFPTFIILLFTLLSTCYAQGNLQFNQALKIDITGPPNVGSGSNYSQVATQTLTVPAGKVWKIESVNANLTKGTYNTSTYQFLFSYGGTPLVYIDNAIILGSLTSSGIVVPHQIYWYPTGSYNFSLWVPNQSSAVTYSYTASITVIEFNIVP